MLCLCTSGKIGRLQSAADRESSWRAGAFSSRRLTCHWILINSIRRRILSLREAWLVLGGKPWSKSPWWCWWDPCHLSYCCLVVVEQFSIVANLQVVLNFCLYVGINTFGDRVHLGKRVLCFDLQWVFSSLFVGTSVGVYQCTPFKQKYNRALTVALLNMTAGIVAECFPLIFILCLSDVFC